MFKIHESRKGLITDSADLSGMMKACVNRVNESIMYRIITFYLGHTFRSIHTVSFKSFDIGGATLGLGLVLE